VIEYLDIDVPEHLKKYVRYRYNGIILKPHPKPSFLDGKTHAEIFSMYEAFANKYDPQNRAHQAELKK